jgi:polysaccharide export outer membrane protein
LPADGPWAAAVRSGASSTGQQYTLIRLTPEVVNTLDEFGPRSISAVFGDKRPPPEVRFGVGDVVSVTIFEAAAGGLFIPQEAGVRPGNFVTLPNQPIDTAGNITVPYAGAVKAAGRTQSQVQQEIVSKIKDRAIEPQAVVALVTQNTSLITVIGEVNSGGNFSPSGRVPAQPAGEHLLDVITRAGGLKDQGQNTWVVLERNGRRAAAPFGSLIFDSQNNIWA